MKKILFNGCSFVAGDAIVWDKYCCEHNSTLNWKDGFGVKQRTREEIIFHNEYRHEYRKQYNLPSSIAKNLQIECVDISEDSYSNDMISISTVLFLSRLSLEKRKQYHVCIGWSALSRLMKYNSVEKRFVNLNALAANIKHLDSTFESYIDSAIVKSYDEDFFLNFIRNLMFLENFLLANDISYTFFKSMGLSDNCVNLHLDNINCNTDSMILSDDNNWYKFDDKLSYMGTSWFESTIKNNHDYHIAKDNRHPNLSAVVKFAKEISDFIKNK